MTDAQVDYSPLTMFYQWEAEKPDATYLHQPTGQKWQKYSWRQVGEEARCIASALKALGMKSGERACILSKNCAHWVISDLAIMMSGCASAPAFTTMTAEDVLYIIEHSGSKVLLVGQTDNWLAVKSVLPAYVKVIAMPGASVPGADYEWSDLLSTNSPLQGNPSRSLDSELTTIYTSGSTGRPKGVVYSFAGAGHSTRNISETFRMTAEDRLISYLPMAHGFERIVVGFMSMYCGCTIGFNDSQMTFSVDMQAVNPTVFQCVPRLWTKFQESITRSYGGQEKLNMLLANASTRNITQAEIRQALGLRDARIMLTGSAPTPMPLHAWYDAVDMPLCEIYGQSEVLSGTSNVPWDRKPGTLGKPTCNTEIKITDQGEILIKAEAVMTGYLHEPEKTAETLVNGWVHTGDKGEIDDDGFLRITGRVKEIFKTTKGKYVAPVPIEGLFVANSYLDQVCLMGHGLPQTLLLAQLSEEGLATDKRIVEERCNTQIKEINLELENHAKMVGMLIVGDQWTSGNGLVTHTMKIKRRRIEDKYIKIVESVFEKSMSVDDPVIHWETIK
jgi:long-chain acyl-CoA synthetase